VAKSMKAIPIYTGTALKGQQRQIADLAFEYWQARFGVRYGSPEEDLFRAEREVVARSSKARNTSVRLFLVPRSGS
jgi:hypothetical protein